MTPKTGSARMLFTAFAAAFIAAMSSAASAASIVPGTAGEAVRSEEHWLLWPLVSWGERDSGRFVGVHPFYTWQEDRADGGDSSHVLWPFVRRSHRPRAWHATDRRVFDVFPFWHSASMQRPEGYAESHRYLVPFYWAGGQQWPDGEVRDGVGGKYFVLFPFYWRARNAEVAIPLFPKRPQTFHALWPVAGFFRGWWNREKVAFLLWPLFVGSEKQVDGENMKSTSLIWPLFGWQRGETIRGFRFWPLFATVRRPGEYRRSYWLWPLGHDRSESADSARSPRRLTLFLPFYGRARDAKYEYDLVFPFYGDLRMKGRRTRGWFMAIYNEDENLRQGVRQHRLLWFVVRWTSRIPVQVEPRVTPSPEALAGDPGPMEGGGVFPFYVRTSNDARFRQWILWPFYSHRTDRYDDRSFHRRFLLPFYGEIRTRYREGGDRGGLFVFPFYRKTLARDGTRFESVPHLFPYTQAEPLDRNWAPLWMAWTRHRNSLTGESRVRLFGNVSAFDRDAVGATRRELNLGVFSWRNETGTDGSDSGRTRVLFGLLDRTWDAGGAGWKILGAKL